MSGNDQRGTIEARETSAGETRRAGVTRRTMLGELAVVASTTALAACGGLPLGNS